MEEPLFEVVEWPEHPEVDYQIYLDELLAHEREDLVEQLVADLGDAPGIKTAHHEDREKVIVAAPDMTAQQLEAWLANWFERQDLDELYELYDEG